MRFLCIFFFFNDKVGTKDFIIIVIYIVKFSSMTLTVSKAFIYIYKVLNGNHPNSSAFILFLPSFFTAAVLCLKTYELSFISANDGRFFPMGFDDDRVANDEMSSLFVTSNFLALEHIVIAVNVQHRHRKKRKFCTLYYVRYQDLLFVSVYFYILSNMLNIIHGKGIHYTL